MALLTAGGLVQVVEDGYFAILGSAGGFEGCDFKSDPSELFQVSEIGAGELDDRPVFYISPLGNRQRAEILSSRIR